MSFNDFSLIPADDPASSASDDLAAATAGAVALPDTIVPAPTAPAIPFGVSWEFDWELGQFTRVGQSPLQVNNFNALGQWCLMAIHSARYAHAVFSDDFAMENPDSPIGEIAAGEIVDDWQAAVVDALMVHDRITSVDNIDIDWDPSAGVLYLNSLDVITDEDLTLTVSDITLQAGASQQ